MTVSQVFHPLQLDFDWQSLLQRALVNGGDWAEIFWERSDLSNLEMREGHLQECSTGLDEGIGLRVLRDGRSVYAFTNELNANSLMNLAREVARRVNGKEATSHHMPWRREYFRRDLPFHIHQPASGVPLAAKLELLRRCESSCLADPKIQKVRTAYSESRRQIFVVRSDGRHAFDDKHSLRLMAFVGGEGPRGAEETYDQIGGHWGFEQFTESSPETLAGICVARLKTLFSAVPAPSGTLAVVLGAEAGGTMIHEAVGHGLEADLAAQKLSVYADQIGQTVAASHITVIDDGTLPFQRGTHAIDDEGNPTQSTVLIENGVLKNYLVDQKMSLRLGRPSTGNGRRQSYRHEPMVRMTNTYLAPGKADPAQILRDTPRGLYVAQMGGGQVDTVSGNFVFNVTEAYLIRNGEKAEAVRGATLSGNGPQVLRQIDRIGRDLGWALGTCGKNGQQAPVADAQPTLRIPELVVGGQAPISDYFRHTF